MCFVMGRQGKKKKLFKKTEKCKKKGIHPHIPYLFMCIYTCESICMYVSNIRYFHYSVLQKILFSKG